MKNLTNSLWLAFSRTLGTTILHPQFTVIKFQKEAIEIAKKYAKGQLVDIGCGRMPYKQELLPLVDSYTGVDHPEVSKLYASGVKPDILADAKALPFREESFDTALLIQVLEHVNDPQKVITEASRILKKDGILIISAPFFYPLHDMPYDWGRYTETALKGFLKNSGLKVIKFKTQGSFPAFWLQMLNTFLVKRINDILIKGFKLHSVFFLLFLMPLTLSAVLINNILILVIDYISRWFPKYPNYFPLDYLLVARKK